ncbi:MAG: CehA/McbA family metallohydrolase, partial [Candidatus Aenigmatarchaeota archaeon]
MKKLELLVFIFLIFSLISFEVKAENYKLFFGDLHGHTFWSDGKGSPAEYFTYCKDVAKLDFCAITDHDVNQTALSNITIEADNFNSLNFVAFAGTEWSSPRYGHKACYNISTVCRAWSANCDTPKELYESVKKDGGLCHAAHPAANWTGQNATDWDVVKDEVEVAGEIYANETKMIEAWSNYKLKLGVVGVSDTHDGRPGSSGVTGCYAKELTRKGILEALKARRCFATSSGANRTHFPMNLSFKINGHWMGEEISLNYGSKLNFEIIVNATYNITSIRIKKNGETIATKIDCNSKN